ncbi:hypothetical protein CY35_07G112600 [Sphagnum magellanicum]|uniref:Uncharacterized protein n=1 Tax=Sphagnum magellanicum TaxID=128215 RepID=A0ACB8HNY5_9BRYO|nr:hypothetical protein CY35_07G112600 [Sphagnum magellanicum]
MALTLMGFNHAKVLENFETHVENLYEGLDAKISATSVFHNVSRHTEWLEMLLTHGNALEALARIFREEGRKSFNLRFNIISIFFMFSLFPRFHKCLLEQKIGKTTLHMFILEIQCIRTKLVKYEDAMVTPPIGYEELGVTNVTNLIPRCKQVNTNLVKEVTIILTYMERLLYMAMGLLVNIAEDVTIEQKMQKCNLVEHLCKILNQKTIALVNITLLFLKKLSIFKESKDAMKQNKIVDQLSHLFPCKHEVIFCKF